jgi:hypothetical protein
VDGRCECEVNEARIVQFGAMREGKAGLSQGPEKLVVVPAVPVPLG